MWKWIGGILLALIVCLMAAAWWGYKKVTSSFSPDGTVRVTIAAPPARVFSSLSDADSAGTLADDEALAALREKLSSNS